MTDLAEQFTSKVRRLVELLDERDQTKLAAESAEETYRDYEAELFEEMTTGPLKGSLRVDLGEPHGLIVFTPREQKFGRIIDLDAALDYFDTRAMTDEMTKPGIAKRRLNELVREHLEQNKPLPDGVDWYARRGITISRKS